MLIENIRKSKITKWIVYIILFGLVLLFLDRIVGLIYSYQIEKEYREFQETTNDSFRNIAEESQNRRAFYYLIDSLIGNNHQEKAIDMLYARINKFPERKSYLIQDIGLIYFINKNTDSAIVKFTEAISLNSGYVLALGNRAQCYLLVDSIDLAISDFEKAASLNWDYFYELGLAQEKKGLLEKAMKSYKEYLKHSYYHGKDCEQRIDSIIKIINGLQHL